MNESLIAHLPFGRPKFGDYAWSYHQAGAALLREARNGSDALDRLALPILYLYRHALELAMKDAVIWASFLHVDSSSGSTLAGLDTHSLRTLGDRLKRSLEPLRARDGESVLDRCWPVLGPAISSLAALDEDGQRLRYPELSRGRGPSWQNRDLRRSLDLSFLEQLIEPALAYLNSDLGAWLDGLAEIDLEDAAIAEQWTEAMWRRQTEALWGSGDRSGDDILGSSTRAEESVALLDPRP
jgi:hypothetical protein